MKALDFLQSQVSPEAPIFVVSGADSFLRSQAVQKILATLEKDVEVQVCSGASTSDREGVDLGDLLDDLRMQSLFGGERMIHVKRADQLVSEHKKVLKRFIETGEAVHRLILEGESIAPKTMKATPKTGLLGAVVSAGGTIVLCAPLYDTSFGGRKPVWQSPLSSWVSQQAREYGKRLTLEDAYHLHRLVGTGLRALDQELRKLTLFLGDRPAITTDDIETCVAGGRRSPIFVVSEACGNRDLEGAASESVVVFARGTVDGSGRHVRDPAALAMMLLRTVGSRFHKIFRVCEILDRGDTFEAAADEVRETPWGRDRLRTQANAFRKPDHRLRALGALRDLERGLKSGGGPPRVLFDRVLLTGLGEPASRSVRS